MDPYGHIYPVDLAEELGKDKEQQEEDIKRFDQAVQQDVERLRRMRNVEQDKIGMRVEFSKDGAFYFIDNRRVTRQEWWITFNEYVNRHM